MANLNQFYSNLFATGIAKPNRFEVLVIPPPGSPVSLNSAALLRQFSLTCEGVDIPSQSLATFEAKINGLPVIPMPYQLNYGNIVTLTFKLSSDYRERNAMLVWQSLVHRPGRGFSYYNEYVGTILVRPLDLQGNPVQEFVFRNCFPSVINDIQYNWASNNENIKQTVAFSFFSAETRTVRN
jgi:hypothetical protein